MISENWWQRWPIAKRATAHQRHRRCEFSNEIYITPGLNTGCLLRRGTVSERFGRLLRIQNSRMRSNLCTIFAGCSRRGKAEHLAEVLSIFMMASGCGKAVDGGFPERAMRYA